MANELASELANELAQMKDRIAAMEAAIVDDDGPLHEQLGLVKHSNNYHHRNNYGKLRHPLLEDQKRTDGCSYTITENDAMTVLAESCPSEVSGMTYHFVKGVAWFHSQIDNDKVYNQFNTETGTKYKKHNLYTKI